ncbi:uncharacterized protein LOC141627550 [Silene latifolia]|uniref:uncharacterized protein LOC141627550 n=1 Tax=Silene latifolia TaxID=37657 RepID=UPI003D774AC5
MAAQQKLATVDNLVRRGSYLVNRCVLCLQASETHRHLFFQCEFSGELWRSVLGWMGIQGRTAKYWQELSWCSSRYAKKHWKSGWFRCCLAATIYFIWQERNARIFGGKTSTIHTLATQLRFAVGTRLIGKYGSGNKEMLRHLNPIYT